MNYFLDKQCELRYYEMDESGFATPTTILTLLEETAADHCFSINHSLYQLAERNIGWVLVSGTMQMERYPAYKEKIRIRTWMSGVSSIRGIRENIIYDEQNNIIGRAQGLWVFFDIERRRPAPIFDDIIKKWPVSDEKSLNNKAAKSLKVVEKPESVAEFRVNKYDTDMIRHVNNIRYLQWLLESVQPEFLNNYYLHSIDGWFVSEAHYGDTVIVQSQKDSDDNSFIHTIKTKGCDKVRATAKTIWKKKKKQVQGNLMACAPNNKHLQASSLI